MKLPPQLLQHKTLMIAILTLARRIAKALEIDLSAPLAETCRTLGANRTSVYEQLQRLLACLQQLAQARPGRPRVQAAPASDPEIDALTVEVLEFRIRCPGAVIEHPHRTTYADAFRRFILQHHDRWQGTLLDFAQAVRVPLDTLRDWLANDRAETLKPQRKTRPSVPANASQLTRRIIDEWMRWIGPTRAFIPHAARCFQLSAAQITRLLKVLGIIRARPRRTTPRFRGSTHKLTPGTLLVTDGKWLTVALHDGDSHQTLFFNWQGIVDQATGCDTAAVVTDQEDAAAVKRAYEHSLRFLGGCVPQALLHDSKPCYDDQQLQQTLKRYGTDMIPATLGRAQNKAILEGAFGLFEQRLGDLKLDDTDDHCLIRSAVEQVVRAYTTVTNHVPRIELHGRSRLQALQEACPSADQRQRDEDFLARLKADHRRPRRLQPRPDSLNLIEHVFERFDLVDHDPKGKLRRYLATFSPAAIRRAAAVLAAKIEQLDRRYAHRYLTQVIRHQQDELDLERAAEELLELCEKQRQDWTHQEQLDFQLLAQQHSEPAEFADAVAQRAAFGGLPLQATFWKRKLLELLQHAEHLVDQVKKTLIRLYEAPKQQRLALLELITAHQHGLR